MYGEKYKPVLIPGVSTEGRNRESGWITVSTGLVGDFRDVLGNKGILHMKLVCHQDRLQCFFFF